MIPYERHQMLPTLPDLPIDPPVSQDDCLHEFFYVRSHRVKDEEIDEYRCRFCGKAEFDI